jgi:uncharacterized integral membrane protein
VTLVLRKKQKNKNDLTLRNFLFLVWLREAWMTEEEKEEIIVKAPSKPVISPEKKAAKAAERALEEERYGVLEVPKRTGKYFGVLSIGVGLVLFVLLAVAGFSGQSSIVFLSFSSSFPVLVLWIVVGLVSIVVGFLLMGSE